MSPPTRALDTTRARNLARGRQMRPLRPEKGPTCGLFPLVGAAGFEPATSCSQKRNGRVAHFGGPWLSPHGCWLCAGSAVFALAAAEGTLRAAWTRIGRAARVPSALQTGQLFTPCDPLEKPSPVSVRWSPYRRHCRGCRTPGKECPWLTLDGLVEP